MCAGIWYLAAGSKSCSDLGAGDRIPWYCNLGNRRWCTKLVGNKHSCGMSFETEGSTESLTFLRDIKKCY